MPFDESLLESREWLDTLGLLSPFGEGGKVIVVGMVNNTTPVEAELHRPVPEALKYISRSHFNMRERGVRYTNVYLGIRLYYNKKSRVYVPYAEERE